MPVNTVEFRELGKRFIFQGGSPYAIGIADEIDKLRIENKQLREANDAFGKRQEWWGKRMFELEHKLLAEREACADFLEHGVFDDDGHHKQYAKAIRARGDA